MFGINKPSIHHRHRIEYLQLTPVPQIIPARQLRVMPSLEINGITRFPRQNPASLHNILPRVKPSHLLPVGRQQITQPCNRFPTARPAFLRSPCRLRPKGRPAAGSYHRIKHHLHLRVMLPQMPDNIPRKFHRWRNANLHPIKCRSRKTQVYLLKNISRREPLHPAYLPLILKSKPGAYRISIYAMCLQRFYIRQHTGSGTLVITRHYQHIRPAAAVYFLIHRIPVFQLSFLVVHNVAPPPAAPPISNPVQPRPSIPAVSGRRSCPPRFLPAQPANTPAFPPVAAAGPG